MKVQHIKTETYRRFTLRPVGRKRVATLNVIRHWRTKDHPYLYVRNYGSLFTVQVMAFELFYYKKGNR